MKTIIRGAVVGLAGTTAMTLAMLTLKKAGIAPGEVVSAWHNLIKEV